MFKFKLLMNGQSNYLESVTKRPKAFADISRDGYFLQSKHFNQYFLCMHWWFLRSLESFSLTYKIINFEFAFLKLLTNFENAYWNPPQNSLLCDGWCSLVTASHWLQRKCARTNLSQAASGMILQNNRRLPQSIFSGKIAAIGPLKRSTRRIFKISK